VRLTREALDRLLLELDGDRERAGLRYEDLRRRLLKYFECRRCAVPDELADEVMDRVARRLAGGERIAGGEPAAYFYGVARNVLREHWRALAARPPLAADPSPILERDDEGAAARERAVACLLRCLDTLPAAQRALLTGYYEWSEGERIGRRRELAREGGMPLNALRIRVHRLREAMEACVSACLARE
jgi:RNA polymerase sigma-70 factor (ECF subfamily)